MSRIWIPFCFAALAACGSSTALGSGNDDTVTVPDTAKVPISDLTGTYRGFPGGLYSNGAAPPSEHALVGSARAKNVRPLDASGNPVATGKYALLSIGMSNTAQEFCGGDKTTGCDTGTFMNAAAADPAVNKSALVIVNAAQGGRDASSWTSPTAGTFDVAAQRLASVGLTERQVQVVWLKQADAGPTKSLPDPDADAFVLESRLGQILRAIKARYPNVQQVFITSRTYAGYAASTLNPEPYAYESGFAVKWVVQAQIDQMQRGNVVDSRAGDLNYNTSAPWIAWGPYPWAAGMKARSDGLTWASTDFGSDGTHPSASGRAKVANMLLEFFKSSPFTRCWFVAGLQC